MDVDYSILADFGAWIAVAREVEPLFGLMADETVFQEALRQAISQKDAFCIRTTPNGHSRTLKGGIVISKAANEIAWLAVSQKYRNMGCGLRLLTFAVNELNPREDIFVQTFDESVFEGRAARRLYSDFGFADYQNGGLNPAGVPTVIMRLSASQAIGA